MNEDKPVIKVASLPGMKLEDGTMRVPGILGDFLDVLAKYLEFNYVVVEPPDQQWGLLDRNGTWTGMIGMLKRSEVELSVGPFSMNPERNAAVHLTYPIIYDFETILLPRPKLENDIWGILKPFPLTVWLLILCCLIVTSMMLIGFQIISKNMVDLRSDDICAKSFMFTLTTITEEGSTWLPSMDGGRVVAAAWLVASTVFISAYSGILVAMLTLPRITIPVDSLEDLVHQNKIPWRVSPNTHFTRLLQESKEGSLHYLAFVRSSGYLGGPEEYYVDIPEGKYAAFFPRYPGIGFIALDYNLTGKCRMYMAQERLNFDMLSLGLRRGSPYLQRVNRVIRAIHEAGLYMQMMKKYYPLDVKCLQSPKQDTTSEIEPLNIYSLGGPFLLLVGGLVTSMVAYLLEIIFDSRTFCIRSVWNH